jgi:hypothetical protein
MSTGMFCTGMMAVHSQIDQIRGMMRYTKWGSRERTLLQAHFGRLALGYVGVTSSCTVRVWECLQSPVGRGSGLACVCPRMNMGCC